MGGQAHRGPDPGIGAVKQEIHLERLLGRAVLAKNGRRVGRLEEVRVEKHGSGLVVTEYHIGPAALLERLSVHTLRLLGANPRRTHAVPWDRLDLSDPDHPRLLCAVEDLAPPAGH
jgi:sporulation protein YlmC with PRC-barrel domain